jgi:hypothetical protein
MKMDEVRMTEDRWASPIIRLFKCSECKYNNNVSVATFCGGCGKEINWN